MSRTKDYDQALTGLGPIKVTIKGDVYKFEGDPPAATVIEWYVVNTKFDPTANQGEKLEANWRLLFGDKNYEKMVKNGVGGRTLDALYTDLLDWWHIIRKVKGDVVGTLDASVWDKVPEDVKPDLRQYILALEDHIEELEDADETVLEAAAAGEAKG